MRVWLGLAFAGVGIITAASVYLFVTDSTEDAISERSADLAVGRTSRLADRIGPSRPKEVRELLDRNRSGTYSVWLFDRNGRMTPQSGRSPFPYGRVARRHTALSEALHGRRYTAELPGTVTVVAAPVYRRGEVDGAVMARSSRPPALRRSADRFRDDSLTALAIAVAAGILVGFLVASAIARRIRRLADSAERIAAGDLEAPLAGGGADEIGDLTRALESMRVALGASFGTISSERDRLTAIFEGLTEAVMVVGHDGTVRFSNRAAEPLVSNHEERVGALAPLSPLEPLVHRAAERGDASAEALRIGGLVLGVQARNLPAEQAVLLVVRDRTDELRRDVQEREFVSNAAHELRNPIAGISSTVEVLRTGAKDDLKAREHFLDRLATDAEKMSRLTQSLLTLARVEAVGQTEAEVVDVAMAGEEASQTIPVPEGIELQIEMESDLAARGDPVLLRQVLVGLLTNAYKNTPPPGKVTLSARRRNESAVVIEVADTGTGISPKELERVFERFYRGSGSLEQEGFGLGLSIARRMVDVMGGEIGASSKEGEGSTFWVRLPIAKPTPTPVA
jgi:two-component system, OmpR family, phosphate regulon sensor histidine kinase PhoR